MIDVLWEDNHLIVVNKPAKWVTQGAAGQTSSSQTSSVTSLYDETCAYIKAKYRKPGRVYLGVVSRLDAPVSGVVCFARTSKAAARLNEQFRGHTVRKTYLAVVQSPDSLADAATASDRCEDFLLHDDSARRVRIVSQETPGAKFASFDWTLLHYDRTSRRALLAIDLHTGRKHQIRVQLAARGMAIVGDTLYAPHQKRYDKETRHRNEGRSSRHHSVIAGKWSVGASDVSGAIRLPERIQLHAWQLSLDHPVRHERMTFTASVPDDFASFRRWLPQEAPSQ